MKIRPLSDRAQFWLLSPIVIPLGTIAFVTMYPCFKLAEWNNDRLERRGYHNWFAWRPVRHFNGTHYMWLETVQRRRGGSHWFYRGKDQQ